MLRIKQYIQLKTSWLLVLFFAFLVQSGTAQEIECSFQKGVLYGYWEKDTVGNNFSERALNLADALGGAKILRKYPNHSSAENSRLADLSRVVSIYFDSSMTVERALQHCLKSRLFEWVEPAYSYQSFWNPNDSLFTSQDALNQIAIPAAWDITSGDTNQIIALVDLGFQLNHPDLVNKFKINSLESIDGLDNDGDGFVDNLQGWDFGDNDAAVSYGNGNIQIHHGTWVAGISGASTNNTIGIAGVAPMAKLLPIKTCSNQNPMVSFGYEGIIYAADHGATVINVSWGGPCDSEFGKIAIRYATQNKGCVVVAAAGNDNARKANYPAAYSEVVSVASVDGSDIRCSASSYHPTVDLVAPGNIVTTNYPSTYRFHGCATSYAAPIVSGVAALLRSLYPTESNQQIAARIINNTDSIYTLNGGFINQLGSGRVNALKAVQNPGIGVWIEETNIAPQRPMPGDTIQVSFQLKNLFTTLNQVYVKLLPELSGYFNAVDDSMYIGTFTGGQQLGIGGFRLVVAQNCPINARLYCFVTVVSGNFTQKIPIEITANATFATLTGLGYRLSIDRRGKFGYPDFPPDYSIGNGLQFSGKCSALYEGGCLFGTSPNNVSNNIRNEFYLLDNDLVHIQQPQAITPTLGDTAIQVAFNDLSAPIPSNVQVSQEWIAFADSGALGSGIVIMRVFNPNSVALDSQYIGLFSDWDVGDFYNQNRADFDAACRLAYAYPYDTTRFPIWVGMTSLDDSLLINCYSEEGSFSFSRQDKYNAISSGTSHVSAGQSATGLDIVQFLSVGPVNIPANTSRTVAFGFVSGTSLAELQQNCSTLRQRYQCHSFGAAWSLSDTLFNTGDTLFASTPTNADSWLWDFGDNITSSSNQVQHTYSQSGNYLLRLIVTSGSCQDTIEQHITVSTTTGNTGLKADIQIFTQPELLIIKNIPSHSTIFVSDLLGRPVYQGSSEENDLQLSLKNGIYGYLITTDSGKKALSGKVFIPFLR